MVNRSDIPMNGSLDELQDRPSEFSDLFQQIERFRLAIMPVGVFLNILCLITFVKSKMSQSATGLTLTYLSIADNIVLLSLFLIGTEYWSKFTAIPSLVENDSFSCQMIVYLVILGFLLSGVLLTSATIERYISVRFALKVKFWNLYVKTKILLVVYFIVAFALSSYSFLCYDIMYDTCSFSQKYDQFCYVSEIIVNTVLSNGLCTLLIFIFTILTSIELFKMKKKRAELGKESTKEFGITVMLVTVATLFLILRIPEMILFQMMNYIERNYLTGSVADNVFAVYPLFLPLVTINHSINFIIYLIFLKKFRDTFFSFFIYVKLKCFGSRASE